MESSNLSVNVLQLTEYRVTGDACVSGRVGGVICGAESKHGGHTAVIAMTNHIH